MDIWGWAQEQQDMHEGRFESPDDWIYARLAGLAILAAWTEPSEGLTAELVEMITAAPGFVYRDAAGASLGLVNGARRLAAACEAIEMEAARKARELGATTSNLAFHAEVSGKVARNRYRDEPPPA